LSEDLKFFKNHKKSYTGPSCITYYQSEIWGSLPINTEFLSVFAPSWWFSVKPNANTYEFWANIWFFLKPIKTHIRDHHVLPVWNMGLTAKKYGVSVRFCPKLVSTYGFWAKVLKKLKPVKTHIQNRYVLTIRNMGVMAKKYRVLVNFCHKLTIFDKTVG
jgi:hypothetical protein